MISDGRRSDPNYRVGNAGKLTFTNPSFFSASKITTNGEGPKESHVAAEGATSRGSGSVSSTASDLVIPTILKRYLRSADSKQAPPSKKHKLAAHCPNEGTSESAVKDRQNRSTSSTSTSSSSSSSTTRKRLLGMVEDNGRVAQMFRGKLDLFTNEPIKTPAISPPGHVLDYFSWLNVLSKPESKDTCPFTKTKLTRRDLVRLTDNNIEEYQNKIIFPTKEMLALRVS